jgi:hypothetical protein
MSQACIGQVTFLSPAGPLTPGERYAVTFQLEGVTLDTSGEFEVGSGPSTPAPPGFQVAHVRRG